MKREGWYYLRGVLPSTPLPSGEPDPWDETSVVGTARPRIDAYERTSGTAVFPSDVVLPDMLYAAILRCPHPHARVRRVDTTHAEAMPGVRAVLTDRSAGADIPWYFGGSGAQSRLFDPHCRCQGDEVAAVAAESPYEARDALRAIAVDYEVLPFVVDAERALEDGAPAVWESGNLTGDPEVYERGDVEAGFAEADVVVEETFSTETLLHVPLELHGCVARWDGRRLTVWESTQGVYSVQSDLARSFGLPLQDVRVIGHYVGGGFGSKLATAKYSPIAALLARKTGRPVKLFLSREETLLSAGNRPGNTMRVKAGMKKDGTLTALEMDGIGSGGAYSASGTGLIDWQVRDLYTCPNVRTRRRNAYTHTGEERPFRAPGHPQGSWALEQIVDMLADKAGIDPVELRVRNVPRVSQGRGNRPWTTCGLRECLERGAREFGWTAARGRTKKQRTDGAWVRGVGMGAALWIAGSGGPPSTVIVRMFVDGSVNLNFGASDIGTGTKTWAAMIAAEELGVPVDSVRIEHADTGTTNFATPSGGSKTVPTEAPTIRAAAADCRRQILAMASRQLDLPVERLRFERNRVLTDDGSELALGNLAEFVQRMTITGVGYRGPNPRDKVVSPFAAQFCEVAVNTRTGELRIERFLGAHDSGRVLNRLTYDSQVYGGIVMGIGMGTTERRVLDRRQTGKMCNLSFHEYKIPTALDAPADMTSVPIEIPDPEANSAGAKGLGEPVTIPTAAAIANAVYDAVGIRVTATPINPIALVDALARRS